MYLYFLDEKKSFIWIYDGIITMFQCMFYICNDLKLRFYLMFVTEFIKNGIFPY